MSEGRRSRRERLQRLAQLKQGTQWFKRITLAVVLLCLCSYLFRHAEQLVISRLVRVQPVQTGTLAEEMTVTATVIREEIPVIVPASGKLEKIAKEGQRVRLGATLATLLPLGAGMQATPGKISLKATQPGVVTYQLDGLEKVLTPGIIENLEAARVNKLVPAQVVNNGQVVESGTAVMKIIDNLKPVLLYIELPVHTVGTDWKVGKGLSVKFPGTEKVVKTRVALLRKQKDQAVLILSLPCQTDFWNPRWLTLSLITNRYQGFILPGSSLVEKENDCGVYVLIGNKVQWRQVKVMGQTGGQVAVQGLTEGMMLIVNPRWVTEGKQL